MRDQRLWLHWMGHLIRLIRWMICLETVEARFQGLRDHMVLVEEVEVVKTVHLLVWTCSMVLVWVHPRALRSSSVASASGRRIVRKNCYTGVSVKGVVEDEGGQVVGRRRVRGNRSPTVNRMVENVKRI
ncbi:hypothetical protein K435DRAFT_519561 [Dendrothele bispora CBS 962.96]|uniref:Uncharacterized protein n=1 Tax=Dendrothele bispora (strain CBS 962.96) TaxID=1314807 RepID=A0A4S8KV97_DENBC|nr:hypothetical protein K435DRAFT_519561 [Dendrothele bispora CBS 962.96]